MNKTKAPLQLHLGCGKRDIPGFINVDLARFSHIHYRRPIDNLSIFKTGSVDLIYSSHSFEYFDRLEAINVLKEWRRTLKRNGILRLAVPDFEAMVRVYIKYGKNLDHQGILGPLFGRWQIPGTTKIVYHKTTYDFKSLKKLLEENGFTKVKKYNWKNRIHKDHDDYSRAYVPHMDEKKGILISLNVEAVKK
ncbi:MAG: methyltransferase domain-containing protein [Candidatus Paceibacterota bacterium]|jgi:predicted SAM-dependent methyltransferase